LELYLRDEGDNMAATVMGQENPIKLLTNPEAKYDEGHALVLTQIHKFKQGQLALYEKMTLYDEILQVHMDHNDYENVIKACNKYAKRDHNLWVKALQYFADKDPSLDCKHEILDILRNIENVHALPPMQVVKLLSSSKHAYMGLLKNYITKNMEREKKEIDEDGRAIRNLQEETKKFKEEILEMKTKAKVWQQTKCQRCPQPLDLPAIHFLCNHSYHQRCLGDNETDSCPECADENNANNIRLKALEENVNNHSEFFRQLEGSTDGFTVVAKYFGRGLFNPVSLSSSSVQKMPQRMKDDGKTVSLFHYHLSLTPQIFRNFSWKTTF